MWVCVCSLSLAYMRVELEMMNVFKRIVVVIFGYDGCWIDNIYDTTITLELYILNDWSSSLHNVLVLDMDDAYEVDRKCEGFGFHFLSTLRLTHKLNKDFDPTLCVTFKYSYYLSEMPKLINRLAGLKF